MRRKRRAARRWPPSDGPQFNVKTLGARNRAHVAAQSLNPPISHFPIPELPVQETTMSSAFGQGRRLIASKRQILEVGSGVRSAASLGAQW